MPPPIVACSAYPLGYGPVAKLIVLARALRARGWEPVFLGSGIARELATRSDVFAEVITAEGDAPEVRRRLGAAKVLLSVMDRSIAAVAREDGRPYCVVDSLLWMRDHVPDVFLSAQRYWVQDFPGVRARLAEIRPTPTVVGPIVPSVRRAETGAELVVNLGGMESPDGPADHAARYAEFVVDGLLRSRLPSQFDGHTVVLGGHRVIEHLRRRHGGTALAFHSLPHEESLSRLARAAVVLTAPGLTTTLECFQLAVPTFFLPPQNYSQWWSLHLLRAHELAPGSFHWQDRLRESPIVERMPEATRGPKLRAVVERVIGEASAHVAYVDHLDAIPSADRSALAARQRAFFESLGPDGTETIARELTELFAEPMDEWIARLFENPAMLRMGHCQRAEDRNLGMGWIYYALGRLLRPARVVVIGSHRGFTPLVFGKALADNGGDGQVWFIDPSLADDFWSDPASVAAHFGTYGVTNVRHFRMTTQEFAASEHYRALEAIDLLHVDGWHTEEQAEFDFNVFAPKLTTAAITLFHDSVAMDVSPMYGAERAYTCTVRLFMDRLKRRPDLQVLDLPLGPGLTLVRKAELPAA